MNRCKASLAVLEAALEAVRVAGGACARVFLRLGNAAHGARLARHPRVVGVALVGAWSDEDFDALCTALETPGCAVRALSLLRNSTEDATLVRLARALQQPTVRVEQLELCFDWAHADDEDEAEFFRAQCNLFAPLCTALAASPWLHTLRLHGVGNLISSEVLLLLRASHTLRELSLSSGKFCGDEIADLARVLSTPRARIKVMHIRNVWVSDTGTAALAEMLQKNTSLRELHAGGHEDEHEVDIWGQELGLRWSDTGVEAMLDAVRHNTTLRQLTLPQADDERSRLSHIRELQLMALRTECPRAADVRFSDWGL